MFCCAGPTVTGVVVFFFFNDTATPEIYPLSLHDALPIYSPIGWENFFTAVAGAAAALTGLIFVGLSINLSKDRKSTRLNSSHANISYAVFCLKKKNPSYFASARVEHAEQIPALTPVETTE